MGPARQATPIARWSAEQVRIRASASDRPREILPYLVRFVHIGADVFGECAYEAGKTSTGRQPMVCKPPFAAVITRRAIVRMRQTAH